MAKAVIQRLTLNFPPKTEFLSLDGSTAEDRTWSEDKYKAKEFDSHGPADDRAQEIRAQTGEHVHAAICQKPIPVKPTPDPESREIKDEPKAIKLDHFRELQCRRDPVEA